MADIIKAVGAAFGVATEESEVNRPPGVIYLKCVLRCGVSVVWTLGAYYIVKKYDDNPQKIIDLFTRVALPAGVVLYNLSRGCLKLSLQADSLSSLEELWKRYTQGVLQKDLSQVLLTPDVLAEAGQNVELEVKIDERIYQEACLDLMVKTVLQEIQNGRSTSSLHRRSLSESNLAEYFNKINQKVFLQPKHLKKITTEAFPVQEVPNVRFLNIDDGKVFEKVLECSC